MKKTLNQSQKQALEAFAHKLNALNGLGVHDPVKDGLADMFLEAAKNNATPMMAFNGEEKPIADVMVMARQKNPDAIHALNALRMQNIDLYVRATLDFSQLYETVTLGAEEQPTIISTYRYPVAARFSGEDGGVRGIRALKAQTVQYINMREMHTDTVQYPLRDINQGTDVASAAQKTFDLGWDLQHRINMELFNFLQGGSINGINYGTGVYRNFVYGGGDTNATARATTNTLVLHPSIKVANLPTTNLITRTALVNGYSHTGDLLSFQAIQAVIDYVEGFRGIFPDGDIEATGLIIMPSSETSSLLKTLNPVGSFYSKVGETVLNSFTKVEYGGRVWTLMGSPLLPKGACYPILNKKVANFYVKPSMDFEVVESFPLKNYEERTAAKVFAMAQIEPWRVNALKVIYATTPGAVSPNY
jgi:hypothetical protein